MMSEPATPVAPEPGTPPAAPAAPAPTPTPEPLPLAAGLTDPALKTWAEGKGWKDVESVVKSAFHLEKMVGVPPDQILRMPKPDDAEGMRGVLQRLGLPSDAKDYEVDFPEGADADYQKFVKETFHKAGLTTSQAKALAKEFADYTTNSVERETEFLRAQTAQEDADLRREWGNGYDRQLRLAQTAAGQLGLEKDALEAIEAQLGYAKTLKTFADLGAKLGEDTFVANETQRSGFHGQMTPAEAKSAIMALENDPESQKALFDRSHPHHKMIVEKRSQLFRIAHPDG